MGRFIFGLLFRNRLLITGRVFAFPGGNFFDFFKSIGKLPLHQDRQRKRPLNIRRFLWQITGRHALGLKWDHPGILGRRKERFHTESLGFDLFLIEGNGASPKIKKRRKPGRDRNLQIHFRGSQNYLDRQPHRKLSFKKAHSPGRNVDDFALLIRKHPRIHRQSPGSQKIIDLRILVGRDQFDVIGHGPIVEFAALYGHEYGTSLDNKFIDFIFLALTKPFRRDQRESFRAGRNGRSLRKINPFHAVSVISQSVLKRLIRVPETLLQLTSGAQLLKKRPQVGVHASCFGGSYHRDPRDFIQRHAVNLGHKRVFKLVQVAGMDTGKNFIRLFFVRKANRRINELNPHLIGLHRLHLKRLYSFLGQLFLDGIFFTGRFGDNI
ncbi:MAG: hypothetical protein BWY44_01317 [Candidatus Omnitrophica bacterium ADurb.Bin292]|nr:MAG: hypothetical protein BWY44_01317 [Candidatus Omnitrophica bacterium ADurb.Bin292]